MTVVSPFASLIALSLVIVGSASVLVRGHHAVNAAVRPSPHAPPIAAHAAADHWTYEGETGPEHWSQIDPANTACSSGLAQSPIDLSAATTASLPDLTFNYHPSAWQIVDNGHTVQVIVPPGNTLTIAGHQYTLAQFHFHHPSEETIQGKHFDMVLHMVHKDSAGKLAVVAVLLADGHANDLVQTLWDNLPSEQGKPKPLGLQLDPSSLIPAQHGYYSFQGSLTTPPCTEGVEWIVMKSPLPISAAEESTFAARYPHNTRPTQPLDGRTVQVSR